MIHRVDYIKVEEWVSRDGVHFVTKEGCVEYEKSLLKKINISDIAMEDIILPDYKEVIMVHLRNREEFERFCRYLILEKKWKTSEEVEDMFFTGEDDFLFSEYGFSRKDSEFDYMILCDYIDNTKRLLNIME